MTILRWATMEREALRGLLLVKEQQLREAFAAGVPGQKLALLHPDCSAVFSDGTYLGYTDLLKLPPSSDHVCPVDCSGLKMVYLAPGLVQLSYECRETAAIRRCSIWAVDTAGWRLRFYQETPVGVAIRSRTTQEG